MPRHVLIVDAVATNRIVLKVRLSSAFYEVDQARSGAEALQQVALRAPTMIIVGSLGDMSVEAFCKDLKSNSKTSATPIVFITGTPDPEHRLAVLRAGADDVIEKPFEDAVLLARLRSLQRARDAEVELQLREATHTALGLSETPQSQFTTPGRVTIVTENAAGYARSLRDLRAALPHRIELGDPRSFLRRSVDPRTREQTADAYVLSLNSENCETGLQILPELRSRNTTKQAGVLVQIPAAYTSLTATALDLGADDVVDTSASAAELALRLDRIMIRKHKADRLRHTVRDGLRAAVTDPLTGLHNRRFALPHLSRVAEQARRRRHGFAVMVADLDHFKQINDTYGHAAGDAVLREVASRLKAQVRPVDLVARIGGEEFMIVMPDVPGRVAQKTAHRLCRAIADQGFDIPGHSTPIRVTISIGMTTERPQSEDPSQCGASAAHLPAQSTALSEALLSRADRALYGAKAHGRNQVELSRPAA